MADRLALSSIINPRSISRPPRRKHLNGRRRSGTQPSPSMMERIFALNPTPSVVLSPSTHILQASDSWLHHFDVQAEEALNQKYLDFLTTRVSDANLTIIRRTIESAISNHVVQSTSPLVGADGTYLQLRALPIFERRKLLYLMVEANDITEEHLRQESLANQLMAAETYRVLVSTVRDYAIFMLDPKGCVATWNAGAAILKQYSQEEIIGKHFSNFYSAEDRLARKPEKELEIAIQDGKVEDEGWRIRKDGTRFWANVIIAPIYHGNVLAGFSKVTRDLTERKASEARLIAAYEEASKLKSDFLANMSHEIRTPMHGMLSALSLLIDTGLNEEQQELAGIIEESGSILLQVINDILDYSKLTSGSFSIAKDVISIPDVVQAVQRCFKFGSDAGLRFEIILDPKLPKFAQGDPLRYRQILQNLVSNAIKFTEEGYIRINVTLTAEDTHQYHITSEVTDTGIGVAPETVNMLFTPFTQLDTFTTKRFKGTGLGLSICKSLAELMGGGIGYRPNSERRGSTFYFTATVSKLETTTSKLPVTSASRNNLKQIALHKHLLLVEDNVINQTIMVRLLRSFGFETIDVASDGAESVKVLKQKPLAYNLVLMDISMPVLDGVNATKQIRAMGLSVPIIAMTANALKGDEEAYLAQGMNDYVAKPVDRRLLTEALLRWLS